MEQKHDGYRYPLAPGADRGGSCPPERFADREAIINDTPRIQKMR